MHLSLGICSSCTLFAYLGGLFCEERVSIASDGVPGATLQMGGRWEEVGKHHGRTARGAARVMTASLAPSFAILSSRSAPPSPLGARQVVRCSPKAFKKQEMGQLTSSERLQISLAPRVDRLLGLVHDAASHCEHGGEGPQLRWRVRYALRSTAGHAPSAEGHSGLD